MIRLPASALTAMLVSAGACEPSPARTEPPPAQNQMEPLMAQAGDEVITIRDTTNHQVSAKLEIAAGNFWEEEYVDAQNVKRKGLTAALWILDKERSPGGKREHVRVHIGQQLSAGALKLRVLDVAKGPDRPFVKLEILK